VFTAYSPSHLVVLAIFAAGTIGLLLAGPRLRGTSAERSVALVLAGANLVFGTISTIDALVPFDAQHSLPLHISGFAWIVIAAALITRQPTLIALTYYWGLTLCLQALVQPTLSQPFPEPAFFVFWGKHVSMVWGAVFLTLALRNGPDWRSYRRALLWTFVWLGGVLVVNALLDSNYGYVSAKPSEATVLDLLGPWPVFVVAEMVIIAGGWAVITLPWTGWPGRRGRVR
jgi:hypothetical integral membrane protein (TIGR02206 family)